MFKSFNIGRKQQGSTQTVVNEMPVKLRMPVGFQGKSVPTSIVMMELLWQQYGLDLVHPEVSRWLERNAPDVKYAMSQLAGGQIEVGSKGTVELNLSLKADDRLREVSSQYILSQVGHSMEPQPELRLAA